MRNNPKRRMVEQARLISGLLNVLKDDVERIRFNANLYNFIDLSDALMDAKDTLQVLMDNVVELEYVLYLYEKEESYL